jgi:hypothetical protein
VQAHGFAVAPISGRVEAVKLDDWQAANSRPGLKRAVQYFCARAEHDAPDLRQAITDERPDALLVDINSWGALAAAEASGRPWAAVCPYPRAMRSRDVLPFRPGLAPAAGPLPVPSYESLAVHVRDRAWPRQPSADERARPCNREVQLRSMEGVPANRRLCRTDLVNPHLVKAT